MKDRGMPKVKWMRCTAIATAIYLMMTILVSFYKFDFLNLTAATIAIYLLTNLRNVKPKFFRMLVAAIIISLLYDINWFWTKWRAYSDEDDEDGGGLERALKRFSWAMATISFFYKPFMCCIFSSAIEAHLSAVLLETTIGFGALSFA